MPVVPPAGHMGDGDCPLPGQLKLIMEALLLTPMFIVGKRRAWLHLLCEAQLKTITRVPP